MTTIGTGVLSGGQASFTTSALTLGSHTIKAVYPGDAGFITSMGVMTQKVLAPTTTTLVSSANPSVVGKSVKFAVKVTSPNGTPGSSVTLTVDTLALGTKFLNAGTANFATSALTTGTHNITAQFNGGPKFAPSSITVTQDVQ
jgi:Bacterial Ig-like domain (group 3)